MRVVYTKYWKDINKARTKTHIHTHTFTRLHTNKTHIQSRYKNHYVNHPQISQSIHILSEHTNTHTQTLACHIQTHTYARTCGQRKHSHSFFFSIFNLLRNEKKKIDVTSEYSFGRHTSEYCSIFLESF